MSTLETQSRVSIPTSSAFDPSFVVQPGTGFDAVVGIFASGGRGSGALLGDGTYVLTAAHVVFGEPVGPMNIAIDLPSGRQTIDVVEVTIHPDYSPDSTGFSPANDIAILRLANQAPITGFDIYRGSAEVGSIFTLTGYGVAGTGADGTVSFDPGDGETKRTGQNRYDAVDGIGSAPDDYLGDPTPDGSLLYYDFDNGNPSNDALGQSFGLFDLGLGASEVNSTVGDSGAPTFINGQIAGIVSGGTSDGFSDIDFSLNASFGEISFDTRVSFFQTWIDSIVGTSLNVGNNPGTSTSGTAGSDNITADLYGGTVVAGDGNDTVQGNVSADIIYGNRNDDFLYGGGGNDILYGGQDRDALFGQDQFDILYGNKAEDQIYGNQGNDTLYGGKLSDSLFGGQGDDALYGGQGDDLLFGNGGADIFVITAGGGSDTIQDYNQAEGDIIVGGTFAPFSASQFVNGGLLLEEGGITLFLVGVTSINDVTLL